MFSSNNRQLLSTKLDHKKTFSSTFAASVISFKFTFESRSSEWVFAQHSDVPRRTKKTKLPPIEHFVTITRGELACRKKAREILTKELGKWAVEPEELRKLIDRALGDARVRFGCMPPQHNSVHLTYRVTASELRILDEGENGPVGPVPSIESTIESLEHLISSLEKLDY